MNKDQNVRVVINDKTLFKMLRRTMTYKKFHSQYEMSFKLSQEILAEVAINRISRDDRELTSLEQIRYLKKRR